MSDTLESKIFKDVVRQHKSAISGFKSSYRFICKQTDIIFLIECSLRSNTSEQLKDQNRLALLTKKIAKRQAVIDKLTTELKVSNTVTEEDVR